MPKQSENVRPETNGASRKTPEIRISIQERLRRGRIRTKRNIIGTRGPIPADEWNPRDYVIGFPEGARARIETILISELKSAGLMELPAGFWICRETKPNSALDYVRYLDAGGNPAKCRLSERLGLREAIALSLRLYIPSIRQDQG